MFKAKRHRGTIRKVEKGGMKTQGITGRRGIGLGSPRGYRKDTNRADGDEWGVELWK